MKHTNRLLAIFLALTMIIGVAVFSVNAETPTENITVDYVENWAEAPLISTDVKYMADIPGSDIWHRDAVVRFQTGEVDGYYTLTAKNENIPVEDTEVRIQIMNADTDGLLLFSLTNDKEYSDSVRLNANTEYYISLISLWKADVAGKASFTLTCVPDPEPNEKKGKILVPSNEFYYGNLANSDDVDWVCLGDYDTLKYRLLLESLEVGQELRAVVYTYSAYQDEVSLTHGETADAVVIPAAAKNERYYVQVTSKNGSFGDYTLRLEELSKVTVENDRTFNSVKFMPVFTNSKYDESYSAAEPVIFGRECVSVIGENTYQTRAECVKISTEDLSGEFEIKLKNDSVSTDEGLLMVEVHKNSRSSAEPIFTTALAMGEEQTHILEFTKNSFYYINFYSLAEENDMGGMVSFKVSQVVEPEETEPAETTQPLVTTLPQETTPVVTETLPTEEVTTEPEEITTVAASSESTAPTTVAEPEETTEKTEATTEDATAPEFNLMLGDTDLSGKINIKDATLIQKVIAKLADFDEKAEKAADVTEDGKVNIKDATAIQKYLAKIDTGLKVGQLILNEIEYSEPATEATEAETQPLTTTQTAETTLTPEPTEVTEAQDPTEATDPTEVTEATEATTVADESTAAEETAPVPTGTLSQLDTLRALNEEANTLLDKYADYENEKPLDENSDEMALKVQSGYCEEAEVSSLSEYEKFFQINDRITYYLMHGYQYTDDHSEYIERLTKAIEWFEYYVAEVHPTPVLKDAPTVKRIFFQNSLNWKKPHIYFWNSASNENGTLWPGEEMLEASDGIYYYDVPLEYDKVVFCSTEDAKYYSVEINIGGLEDYTVIKLIDEFDNGYKYETWSNEPPHNDY